MAIQKQQNDGRTQQGMTTQRGQDERQPSIARRPSAIGRPISRVMQQNPLAVMRRMLDELDVSPLSSPLFGSMGNPVAMMRRMFNDMERMLETGDIGVSDEMDLSRGGLAGLDFVPRIDVRRREDKLIVRADLPGISQDQVRIFAQDDALVIEGERDETREHQREDRWQSERIYGRFQRVIPLPDGVQAENAEARFENGVLEVTVPISESQGRGRRIQIQGAGSSQGQIQGQGQQNKPAEAGQQPRPAERH